MFMRLVALACACALACALVPLGPPLELGDDECALYLAGPPRTSAYDYSLNLLRGSIPSAGQQNCITYDAINQAYLEARKRILVSMPKGDWKAEHYASVGELMLDISINLARTYGLSYEEIEKGLPLIDTSRTLIREVCPPVFSHVECRAGKYRRYDGLCTNLDHPTWGATMAPFQRLLGPLYADGMNAPRIAHNGRDLPLSRVVSRTIHPDDGFHDHAGTIMVIAWGQFMDHDFTLTGTPLDPRNRNDPEECCKRPPHLKHPYCNEIRIPDDDYFYRLFGVKCIDFVRSFPSPRPGCRLGSRTPFNTLTGVIDGNTVYGVTEHFARKLRTGYGGLLRMNPVFEEYGLKDLLPLKLDIPDEGCTRPNKNMYCFEAGEIRVNEQLVLTVMHTLMAREHNRVAKGLAQVNPHWDDETLYQEARRINIAEIQHITFNEFLPILLGKDVMEKFGLILQKEGHWDGYDSKVNPDVIDAFASAAYRFGHSLLPTTVERWSKAHKFIASKRLSDLIRRPYDLYRAGVFDEYVMGLMNQVAQAMDDSITQEVTNHLFKKVGAKFGMDLVSFNMQRGREFGIPGYMEFRKFCGLPDAHGFEDLFSSMPNETVRKYESIFEHPIDIDLWSGGVSERPLPGSLLGPTFACIIATQFSYSRRGDRFWYELPNQPSSFTPQQLTELRKARLSRVICDNTDIIDTVQVYPMVLPDHELNPRVPCRSGVIPSMDFRAWAEHPDVAELPRQYLTVAVLGNESNPNEIDADFINDTLIYELNVTKEVPSNHSDSQTQPIVENITEDKHQTISEKTNTTLINIMKRRKRSYSVNITHDVIPRLPKNFKLAPIVVLSDSEEVDDDAVATTRAPYIIENVNDKSPQSFSQHKIVPGIQDVDISDFDHENINFDRTGNVVNRNEDSNYYKSPKSSSTSRFGERTNQRTEREREKNAFKNEEIYKTNPNSKFAERLEQGSSRGREKNIDGNYNEYDSRTHSKPSRRHEYKNEKDQEKENERHQGKRNNSESRPPPRQESGSEQRREYNVNRNEEYIADAPPKPGRDKFSSERDIENSAEKYSTNQQTRPSEREKQANEREIVNSNGESESSSEENSKEGNFSPTSGSIRSSNQRDSKHHDDNPEKISLNINTSTDIKEPYQNIRKSESNHQNKHHENTEDSSEVDHLLKEVSHDQQNPREELRNNFKPEESSIETPHLNNYESSQVSPINTEDKSIESPELPLPIYSQASIEAKALADKRLKTGIKSKPKDVERIPLDYMHDKSKNTDTETSKEKPETQTANDSNLGKGDSPSIDFKPFEPEEHNFDSELDFKFKDSKLDLPEIILPHNVLDFYNNPLQKQEVRYDDDDGVKKNKKKYDSDTRYDKFSRLKANDDSDDESDSKSFSRYHDAPEKETNEPYKKVDEESEKEDEGSDEESDDHDNYRTTNPYHNEDEDNEDLYEKFVRERFNKKGTFGKRNEEIRDFHSSNPTLYANLQKFLDKAKNNTQEAESSGPNYGYKWNAEYNLR